MVFVEAGTSMADEVTVGGYTDVAPAGFTFALAADAAVLSASLSVYSDAGGAADISGSLDIEFAPDNGAAQRAAGFVSFLVRGAQSQAQYFARATLDFGAGPVTYPAAVPLAGVTTSAVVSANESAGALSLNALTVSPTLAPASLALLGLSASPYALGSYSADGLHRWDLNRLKDGAGNTLVTMQGDVVTVNEYFGASCQARPQIVRKRRVPDANGSGSVLQFSELESCFFADSNCDDLVDVLDLQYLLGYFPTSGSNCGFNGDIDADADGQINIIDLQALLNRFGDGAPF
jgi:hypothetical protein